jgi:seryl-tRNA synthetase
MLDTKFIRENREIVEMAMQNKKVTDVSLDELLAFADKKKELGQKLDAINAQRNEASKTQNIEEGRKLKEEGSVVEAEFNEVEKKFIALMLKIPNIPSADTPIGNDDNDNKVIRQWGEPKNFSFEPKAHWDIGKDLNIIDSERAGNISGSRFSYIKGDLVRVQFALVQFAFDTLTNEDTLKIIAEEAGLEVSPKPFTLIVPPTFVKPAVYNRMARLEPREDKYYLEQDDVYLAGSAEHTVGPYHMDEVLAGEDLPLRYLGYSTCFRREAGSYGKDTKGILRQHQFDKMEMESFTKPEDSLREQDFLVAIQEYMLRKLNLPHQVVQVCTGDMGMPDYRQVDIETWMPGQNTYRETHSADLMTSFQSRRLNTRYKNSEGKLEFVHMNDATLFAIGRTLIAIIENYQQEDGTVLVPDVLKQYMGGTEIIKS